MAEEAGYKDMNHFKFVSNYLTNGAKIGCEGEGRWPTRGRNDPSVSTHGWEIADEILTWIDMGICVGPLKIDELPFEDFSVSPLSTRMKPNGRVRLILDLTYPHTGTPGQFSVKHWLQFLPWRIIYIFSPPPPSIEFISEN